MARSFNGSTDWLALASAPVSASPVSWSLWVYDSGGAAQQTPFALSNSGAATTYFETDIQAGKAVRCAERNSANAVAASGGTLSAATWTHVCGVVRTGGNDRSIFLAGTKTSSTTSTTAPSVNQIQIGRRRAATTFFAGRLAEIGLWNVALSDATVAALAAGDAPSLHTTGLVAYWPLIGDDNDASGNGHHLTANGSPGFVTHPGGINYPSSFLPAWARGANGFLGPGVVAC